MNKTKIDLIELLERWHKEKEEQVKYYPSWENDGDTKVTQWFNPLTSEWCPVERWAFKGFVAREISADIDKLWES